MSQTRSVVEFEAGKSQLESLRAVLRSESLGWQHVVAVILDFVGTDLVLTCATDPDLPLNSERRSLGTQLGHKTLGQFITSPFASNGLNLNWDVWVEHVKAAVLAERFSIKTKDLTPKKLLQLDRSIADELGRFASSGPEWHSTRASIEEEQHNMIAARIHGEARKHRDKSRKLLESLHKLNSRFDEVSSDLDANKATLKAVTGERNTLSENVARLEAELTRVAEENAAHISLLESAQSETLELKNLEMLELHDFCDSKIRVAQGVHTEEMLALDEQLRSLQTELALKNELVAELEHSVKDKNVIAAELKRAITDVQYLESSLSKSSVENDLLLDECKTSQSVIKEQDELLADRQIEIDKLNSKLEVYTSKFAHERSNFEEASKKNTELTSEILSLRSYLNENPIETSRQSFLREVAELQRDNAQDELEKKKQELLSVRRRLSHAESVIIDGRGINTSSKTAQLQEDYNILAAELKDTRDDLGYSNVALRMATEQADILSGKAQIAHMQLEGACSEIKMLRKYTDHLESMLGEDTLQTISFYQTQIGVLKNHRKSLQLSLQSRKENIQHLINVIERAKSKLKLLSNLSNTRKERIHGLVSAIRSERDNISKQKTDLLKFKVRVGFLLCVITYCATMMVVNTDMAPAAAFIENTSGTIMQKVMNAVR